MNSSMVFNEVGRIFGALLLLVSGGSCWWGWSVIYQSEKICALKGSSVVMACSYKFPSGKVEKELWFIEQEKLNEEPQDLDMDPNYAQRLDYLFNQEKKNCTLRIKDLRMKDSLRYRFRFKTNKPTEKYTGQPGVLLSVTDLEVKLNPDTVIEQEQVTLFCHTTCTLSGDPSFIWYKNGYVLPDTNTASSLVLHSVSSKDTSRYSCAVRGHDSVRSLEVSLNVNYAPKNTSVSFNPVGEIMEGSSVTLTCSSDANPSVETYTWFKVNGAETSEIKTGQSYIIPDICSEDSGLYYCVAQNKHGSENSTLVLMNVHYLPKNTSVSVSFAGEIMEGSSVTLTCSSDANPSVETYTWFKVNGAETSEIKTGQSYIIPDICSEDSGLYYCVAQNKHGSENSTLVLMNVHYLPKNTSVSVSFAGEIMEGSSVTLTCSSDANPSVETYTWFKVNGAESSEIKTGQSYILPDIRSEDSGLYYCVAQNKHGSGNSTTVFMNVHSPSYGTVPIIVAITASVCLVILCVIVWLRKQSSLLRRDTDIQEVEKTGVSKQVTENPVYDNVSSGALTHNATEESHTDDDYVDGRLPHSIGQEETFFAVPLDNSGDEDDILYSTIQFPGHSSATKSPVQRLEDASVIYSKVGNLNTVRID